MASGTRVGAAWVVWVGALNAGGVLVYRAADSPRPPQDVTKADPLPLVPPRTEPKTEPKAEPSTEAKKPAKDGIGKKVTPPSTREDPGESVPVPPEPKKREPKSPDIEVKKDPPKPPEPKPPAGILPDKVDWSRGDQLVLVVDPGNQSKAAEAIGAEVAAIKERFPDRLVGGDVFVVGASRLRRWADRDAPAEWGDTPEKAFAKAFTAVATAQEEAVNSPGAEVKQTLVIWHADDCPEEPVAGVRQIRRAVVVWSGMKLEEQRNLKAALTAVFGKDCVSTHGQDIQGLANTVANAIPKQKP